MVRPSETGWLMSIWFMVSSRPGLKPCRRLLKWGGGGAPASPGRTYHPGAAGFKGVAAGPAGGQACRSIVEQYVGLAGIASPVADLRACRLGQGRVFAPRLLDILVAEPFQV